MSQNKKYKNTVAKMASMVVFAALWGLPDQANSQDSHAWQPPTAPAEHIPSSVSIPLPDPNGQDGQSFHSASPIPSTHWPEPAENMVTSDDHGVMVANLDIPIPDMSDADNPMGFLERVGNGASDTIQGIFGEESSVGNQIASVVCA